VWLAAQGRSQVAARRSGVVERLQTVRDVFASLGARKQADAEDLLQKVWAAETSSVTARIRPSVFGDLTEREWEVARLGTSGLTDKEVAAKMYVSPRTVDNHLRSIFRKLDVRSRTSLAAYAKSEL